MRERPISNRISAPLGCLAMGLLMACSPGPDAPGTPASSTSWTQAKASQVPTVELASEFATPRVQPVATLAWEDGVYISRDGLTLYSDYLPFDALKASMDGATPDKFYRYGRGPDVGQDFTNPLGKSTPWLHSDIVYATRSATTEPFSAWRLSGMHGRSYNLGAPQGIPNAVDGTKFDYFAYTDDTGGPAQIRVLRDVGRNPSGMGALLPSNVSDPHSILDNPHLERPDPSAPNSLVLFFESTNRPGGNGKHEIWYTTSQDGGTTWANPQLARSVDAGSDEQQPHLYHDVSGWWLYYSATNAKDGKLAVYRAKQGTPGNWDSWQTPQLVLSAGTTLGVGEPTLTASGDLSFVAIFRNPQGTSTDQFDSDPWFAPHR